MMRIFVLVFASLFVSSSLAQRPSFAGSRPVGRPDLAARFKNPTSTETLNSRVGVVVTTPRPTETINNRVGVVVTTPRSTEDVNEANTWSTNALNSQGNQNPNLTGDGFSRNNDLPRPHRPSFAGSRPVGYPDLAPRFRETSTHSINNRVGGETTTTWSGAVDGLGDRVYVDRVNAWPRENRPFDVLNSQHVRDHLYNQGNQNVQSRAGFEQGASSQRPSFAGSRSIGRPEVAGRFKNVEDGS